MHWKLKALIQNAVALLPPGPSLAVYYQIQRHFGGLRQFDLAGKLRAGAAAWRLLRAQGAEPAGKVFLEVGTGRVPAVPLVFWLLGARETITIDLNPYLRAELVRELLDFLLAHQDTVAQTLAPCLDQERLAAVLALARHPAATTRDLLALARITYLAPGDAACTGLAGGSIDFHTSYTVLEHIPPAILRDIIKEGNRLLRPGGLFVHRVDYSDHFSHADPSLTPLNFLRYAEATWRLYAGNRFMYMNRLRHDDYLALFQSLGHQILAEEPEVDPRCLELLQTGALPLASRFAGKTPEVLAITGSWLVSRPRE
ncbi:MAG: class I SAM-dependent methyltransferase [Deltaproteobacteria bacterium]|nr:class I SAM-dependent methyltransferase [Deltaproteobacteria bacterium]